MNIRNEVEQYFCIDPNVKMDEGQGYTKVWYTQEQIRVSGKLPSEILDFSKMYMYAYIEVSKAGYGFVFSQEPIAILNHRIDFANVFEERGFWSVFISGLANKTLKQTMEDVKKFIRSSDNEVPTSKGRHNQESGVAYPGFGKPPLPVLARVEKEEPREEHAEQRPLNEHFHTEGNLETTTSNGSIRLRVFLNDVTRHGNRLHRDIRNLFHSTKRMYINGPGNGIFVDFYFCTSPLGSLSEIPKPLASRENEFWGVLIKELGNPNFQKGVENIVEFSRSTLETQMPSIEKYSFEQVKRLVTIIRGNMDDDLIKQLLELK